MSEPEETPTEPETNETEGTEEAMPQNTPAPMTDAEFEAAQARLEAERERRQQEQAAQEQAYLEPLQAVVHGTKIGEVLSDINDLMEDEDVLRNRNHYRALENIKQMVENAQRVIPAPASASA